MTGGSPVFPAAVDGVATASYPDQQASARERLQLARAAIQRWHALGALVRPPAPAALADADRLDEQRARGGTPGALHGMPVVIKDNIAVSGLPLTGASPALAGCVASHDAGVVARLRAAGAVVAAQTNMHELALGTTSDNAHHGPVRNPWDLTRSAGGSSGGSAALVAAGAVRAALGTDTGGSGRIPAALCGCVGFRPSSGRWPGYGVLTLSPTMDTVALFGADVATVGACGAVLAAEPGAVGIGSEVVAADGLRVGVPRSAFWYKLDPRVAEVAEAALRQLSGAGVVLVDVDLRELRDLDSQVAHVLAPLEIGRVWTRFARDNLQLSLGEFAGRLSSSDVAAAMSMIAAAGPGTEAELRRLRLLCVRARGVYERAFVDQRLDALVWPTLPVQAPHVGRSTVSLRGEERNAFTTMTSHSTPASISGVPSLSLPAGLDADGLPVGLSLDGPRGGDRRLLAVAAAVEAVLRPLPNPPGPPR